MSSKIRQTHKKTYKEILSSTISFHIPTFQRSYNWMPRQVTQLWESILSNDNQYYIGNIVVVQHSAVGIESGMLVIDGQQRLTTLSLFLVAIRDFIKKDQQKNKQSQSLGGHKEMIEEIESFLIYKTSFSESSAEKLKLAFSKPNLASVYRNIVFAGQIDEELDDAQKRFTKNLNVIERLFKGYLNDHKGSTKKAISRLVNKVIDLEFIVIECQSENDVYQIFEGLNSTGLELSVVDLVKNAVFKFIGDIDKTGETLSDAEDCWLEMEAYFEQTNLRYFSKFLRHWWISRNGYTNNSQLYEKIKKEVSKIDDRKTILNYIEDLKNDAKLYVSLRTGDMQYLEEIGLAKSDKIKKQVVRFQYLDTDQVYEVLLAYCKRYQLHDEYTEKQFIRDVSALWNFGFQVKILSSINPSKYERIFAERCKKLASFRGKKYNQESNKFYSDLSNLLKGRGDEFLENFRDVLEYKEGRNDNNELLRIVLLEIYKNAEKSKSGATYDKITIDHILPKSKFRNESFVHKIGNLTVLSDPMNKRAGNTSFALKFKNHLKEDIFKHNKTLNKYDFDSKDKDVLRDTIEQRATDLAKEAINVFGVA